MRESEALLSLDTYEPALVRSILQPASSVDSALAIVNGGSSLPTTGPSRVRLGLLLHGMSVTQRRIFSPSKAYAEHHLAAKFNTSQRAAIDAALTKGGLTLIQVSI
jgi:hypothetical protein